MELETEAGPTTVIVERRADVGVSPGLIDQPDRLAAFFASLDLTSIDRLVGAIQSDRLQQRLVQEPGTGVTLNIGATWTGLYTSGPEEFGRVTTASLVTWLEEYREFLASWTEGEYVDLILQVSGSLQSKQTVRMARACDGTVQAVQGELCELAYLLMDVQDATSTDFLLDQLNAVIVGGVDERRTGTNLTGLVMTRRTTSLSILGSTAVELGTRELYDLLNRLRGFIVRDDLSKGS